MSEFHLNLLRKERKRGFIRKIKGVLCNVLNNRFHGFEMIFNYHTY